MKVIYNKTKSMWFDVDNTLVISKTEYPDLCDHLKIINILGREFGIHQKHIELLKDCNARGHQVVVWSAGGAEWVEIVIRALELEEFVSLVIAKPDWFTDDLPASEWLSERKRTFKPVLSLEDKYQTRCY